MFCLFFFFLSALGFPKVLPWSRSTGTGHHAIWRKSHHPRKHLRAMLPYVSGSQTLLPMRITWGLLKPKCPGDTQYQWSQCMGWKPGISVFKDPQVIPVFWNHCLRRYLKWWELAWGKFVKYSDISCVEWPPSSPCSLLFWPSLVCRSTLLLSHCLKPVVI